jgi:two-component system, NarL family, sensor histidine kinase BarA
LQRVNFDLDAKVDELAQLNMRLHEMNRLKGDFLATMSHELRTPLNSIIGFSDLLAGIETLNEKQRRYAKTIHKSGRDLLEMINDILDLAKLEAGKMDLRLSEFRIEAIIQTQCDMVSSLTEEKNIDLAVEIEDDLPPLFQDQAKVQQILTNLLSNAIKFTPEGGRIVVGARADRRGYVEMFVADTGVGIAEADREIIFEKFRQGTVVSRDNLTREFSGTGLGLSIVKELCKLLGGEVSVESELGKGSTFRVLIPWMRADQPQAASKLNSKLDEMTRPRRIDFERDAEPAGVGSNVDDSRS